VLTRRGFVQLVGLTSLVPACGDNIVLPLGRFFSNDEWDVIDIASGFILPDVARQTMAVRYIDTLLSAFDVTPPAIFGGGPDSGRHGGDASFAKFLPLSRVQEIAWRMRIFGSAATAGGTFNDALLGARTGWRDLYKQALARFPVATYRDLAEEDQSHLLDEIGTALPAWITAFTEHVIEGAFAAPEYGGNAQLLGWKYASYDGDSAPLGHATYDGTSYHDNPDQPTSTGDGKTEAFDASVINVLTVAAIGSGGKKFF
jgi:hypothetical protein